MTQTLCAAVRGRQVVEFTYQGRSRTAEPHIVGYDHEGEALLSAWQLTGGSGRGFRSFRLSELTGIRSTPATFAAPRPGYNPRDPKFARVACQL